MELQGRDGEGSGYLLGAGAKSRGEAAENYARGQAVKPGTGIAKLFEWDRSPGFLGDQSMSGTRYSFDNTAGSFMAYLELGLHPFSSPGSGSAHIPPTFSACQHPYLILSLP